MKLFAKKKSVFYSIIGKQHELVCARIIKSDTQSTLTNYKRLELDQFTWQDQRICNPTKIKNFLRSCVLPQDHIAFISLALWGPGVRQTILTLNQLDPEQTDFNLTGQSRLQIQHNYLYPVDDGQFAFYVLAIEQPLLLQWYLIVNQLKLPLYQITTPFNALIKTYRQWHGDSFRHTKFAIDMIKCENHIEKIVAPYQMQRIMNLDTQINMSSRDRENLPILFGLTQ